MARQENRPASEVYERYYPGELDGLSGPSLLAFDAEHLSHSLKQESDAAKDGGSAKSRIDAARQGGGYDDLLAFAEGSGAEYTPGRGGKQ